MTTSFQGPDEIVTSYEHIGRNRLSDFGGFNFRGGMGMGYKETSLCAPDYVSFDLKAETDLLMNRTEQLFSAGGGPRSPLDDRELVI